MDFMLPAHGITPHPGEMLLEEFLKPMKISVPKFAAHIGISVGSLRELVAGRRALTGEEAWLIGQALGTSAEMWMGFQGYYNLTSVRPVRKVRCLRKYTAKERALIAEAERDQRAAH